jgi:hypothetical protein
MRLAWIPGHKGNEKADGLARQDSDSYLVGPEPFCPVSISQGLAKLRSWEENIKSEAWSTFPSLWQSKQLTKPHKEWGELLKLSKGDTSLLVGLLTGHGPLRKHLKIIELSQMGLLQIL